MKVTYPISGFSFTSKDILPASCTSKPQVTCTSVPKARINEGLSNQEIYETLVNVKERISSLFGGKKNPTQPLNYVA
ncbi:MAG: hypothetical protein K6E29_03590 [Cyanobacteria bacterium RUI128]|nr:hypothetical protein [Cyanobacteria bacterium RUI128]